MNEIIQILMKRDGLTLAEAAQSVKEARELVADGANPEEVLEEEFGLEPDYILDLL